MLLASQPVRSLLLSIFMLMAASGLLATLISLRPEQAGSGAMTIGMVAIPRAVSDTGAICGLCDCLQFVDINLRRDSACD